VDRVGDLHCPRIYLPGRVGRETAWNSIRVLLGVVMLRTFWLFVVSTSTWSLFVVKAEKVRTVIGAKICFEGEILGGSMRLDLRVLLLILIVKLLETILFLERSPCTIQPRKHRCSNHSLLHTRPRRNLKSVSVHITTKKGDTLSGCTLAIAF
jgi:hypothetical protein